MIHGRFLKKVFLKKINKENKKRKKNVEIKEKKKLVKVDINIFKTTAIKNNEIFIKLFSFWVIKNHSIESFQDNLNIILDRLKIPKGLNELGVPEDCQERIAKKSMLDQAYGQNPKKASLDEVKTLVLESIRQAR